MTYTLIGLAILIVILILAVRWAWREYQRPFFKFDEDQALRDIEEALSKADSDLYTRKQFGDANHD